eukprot:6317887-Pyramimonas_sp.AAC.1
MSGSGRPANPMPSCGGSWPCRHASCLASFPLPVVVVVVVVVAVVVAAGVGVAAVVVLVVVVWGAPRS